MPTLTESHAKRAANYCAINQSAQALRYETEIDPASASFYVTANGVPIARFGDHCQATAFVLAAQGLTE
jgi:hypothetical protein